MGTCGSKCRPKPSSVFDPSVTQDKLVVSGSVISTAVTCTSSQESAKKQAPASVSPSTTGTTSTPSSSFTSSTPSTSSSSSSSSSSTYCSLENYVFANHELLRFDRKKQKAQVVVLDPRKEDLAKRKIVPRPIERSCSSPKPVTVSGKERSNRMDKSLPSKRARPRNTHPSSSRQNSFRKIEQQNSTKVPQISKQNSVFSSGRLHRVACRDVSREVLKDKNCKGIRRQEKVARKEILRSLPTNRQNSFRDHQHCGNVYSTDMLCKQNLTENSVTENFDNPLISMDCFIFL